MKYTLFDIYYEPEKLQWDLLQERLEYKLKLHYDPVQNLLLIPTVEISQAYFMMDFIFTSLKFDESLEKHFRMVGPSATSKSTILHSFAKRSNEHFISCLIPMSSYLTYDKMKKTVESFYH